MTKEEIKAFQKEIIQALGVNVQLEYDGSLKSAIDNRISFIKHMVRESSTHTLVLGISGGVDSLTAGRLCQLAVEELREEGDTQARFIAVRLPYKTQADESDAQRAIEFIKPDVVADLNIEQAVDGLMANLRVPGIEPSDYQADFAKGNVKARTRMMAQYAIANLTQGLVVGTDHAAEAVMGFFTKFGDGACDLAPLSGLVKNQVRRMAVELGAPTGLAFKTPTADLEDLDPGKPDEKAYGCTYDEIDSFLLGREVDYQVAAMIILQYRKTQHKRSLPFTPV